MSNSTSYGNWTPASSAVKTVNLMQLIRNDVGPIGQELSELLTGASFDKFSYSGLYSMEFTLRETKHGFEYYILEIATEISIREEAGSRGSDSFSADSFLELWSKVVDRVELGQDLSLRLYFDNLICEMPSVMDDPEGLFDLRWAIYPVGEKGSFLVWVSDEENIFLRK